MAKRKSPKLVSPKAKCDNHLFITDAERGETVCKHCGVIGIEKISDDGQGERFMDDRKFAINSRVGPTISLAMYDKGLYTKIGDANKDSMGKSLKGINRSSFDRLRKWDVRSKSNTSSRNLGAALTILNGLSAKLAIPEGVTEEAAYIYRKVIEKKLTGGRTIAPFIVASLYVACRETDTPRSIDDLAKHANIRRTTISRAIRITLRSLDLKLKQYDIEKFIVRIANDIDCKEKTKRDALHVFQRAKDEGFVDGKNPVAVACASVYVACSKNDEAPSQNRLSKVSSVSAVTIRNLTGEIKRKLKF